MSIKSPGMHLPRRRNNYKIITSSRISNCHLKISSNTAQHPADTMPEYAQDQPAGYNNYVSNIVLVGAGGQVGSHIASALLATGKHTVTALTREGSASKLPAGLKVARVPSYDDEAAVEAALKAADAQVLIITLGVTASPETQPHLIKAACAAGVRFILPNSWGIKMSDEKLAEETFLGRKDIVAQETVEQAGGVSRLIFIACGFWYEFSLAGGRDRYGFDFDERVFLMLDDGETKMHTSTWTQTGRAVAAALSLPILPQSPSDEALTLSGVASSAEPVFHVKSFLLSQKDMFESVKRVTGTTDADWTVLRKTSKEQYEEGRDAVLGGDMKAYGKLLYGRGWFPGAGKFDRIDNEALGLPEEDLDAATKEAVRMAMNHEVPY
ncbi:hypothetical protein MAPG_04159 [Magnaporthiopsis poae ATCC 64411]|uniref:NAD(P)-binding domain-containing protein n=1 Tax=Magnaporthiopsis poae (strain ATCC 64411 / 73-15) TaxID=644358 RepID=A0A0C4DVZ1_MAGP6|nr:hypothetical protein MAPG_04159 [Magnaporthiopsis poae ATCC 64411]